MLCPAKTRLFPPTVPATAVFDEREQEFFLFIFVVVVVVVVVFVVLGVDIRSALPAQCRIRSFETQQTAG